MFSTVSIRSNVRVRAWLLAALFVVGALIAATASLSTPARAAPTLNVNSTVDSVDGSTYACPATNVKPCTLRLAIDVANSDPGSTINVAPGTYALTTHTELQIRANMTIVGADARNTIIDADGSNAAERVFEILGVPIDVSISHVTIQNGKSDGGGIFNTATGTVTLDNVAVVSNTASAAGRSEGGGIWNGNESTMVITNSLIAGNKALHGTETLQTSNGGGIFNLNALTVTNTTIQGNQTDVGGGIFNQNGTVTLLNDTISQNIATTVQSTRFGGGIADSVPEHYTLTNTIVAGNTNADCFTDATTATSFISGGHNIDGDSSCGLTGTADQSNTDPSLQALALNSPGQTSTMAIGPGSAALDKADTTKCPAADQRGVQRRTDGACDIGAFEFVEAASAVPLLPRSGTPAPVPGTPVWPIAGTLLVLGAAALATARTLRRRR